MRPIDADALKKWVEEYHASNWGIPQDELIYAIGSAPTIEPKDGCEYWDGESGFCALHRPADDVPDRKVGEWYDWSFTAFDGCTVWHRVCSVCGYKRDDDNLDKDTNYCPNCGAKMERSE